MVVNSMADTSVRQHGVGGEDLARKGASLCLSCKPHRVGFRTDGDSCLRIRTSLCVDETIIATGFGGRTCTESCFSLREPSFSL
jgi:hypothetical protein